MKKVLLLLVAFIAYSLNAQIYQSYNINLLSISKPNNGPPGDDGRLYSGCWGWYQASKNKEYGICGTSNGTYFIDVTSPTNPTVCAFVPGKLKCTYREIKTYQNYCYISSDDALPNNFQIIDMQYLPDSIKIISSSDSIFARGHTMWIDQDKLYVGAATYTNGFSAMSLYSLATPSAPVILKKLQQDVPFITYVHDMYVRNDTIYASCGDQGLYIFKYLTSTNSFTQLGSYTGYQSHGYSHSSTLTKDGKHLLFCDEVPAGLPIHVVNVENLNNLQPINNFHPNELTTPHNPFLKGNFIMVSCYQDGLYIYDMSQPNQINIAGYFDTHPQGGANMNDYKGATYRGNWGAYPYLPSGIIIANDMQNGMFVLDASAAYTTSIQNPVSISEFQTMKNNFSFYPNPASSNLVVTLVSQSNSVLQVRNILGEIIYENHYKGNNTVHLDTQILENGTYFISVTGEEIHQTKKFIIQH